MQQGNVDKKTQIFRLNLFRLVLSGITGFFGWAVRKLEELCPLNIRIIRYIRPKSNFVQEEKTWYSENNRKT